MHNKEYINKFNLFSFIRKLYTILFVKKISCFEFILIIPKNLKILIIYLILLFGVICDIYIFLLYNLEENTCISIINLENK